MMFDRFVTLCVFQPLNRIGWHQETRSVPVLMYHSVSDEDESGVAPYYRLCISPRLFAEHMQVLHDEGFDGVDLHTALDWLSTPTPLPGPRPAVITFDDGFRDFLTAAWPALREHGFTATMFLPTASIGDERQSFKGRECLTWDEVRRLRQAGAHFGSHTVNHPLLVRLDDATLHRELRDSKQTIERELGETIDTFAHPFAFPSSDSDYVRRLRGHLTACGYRIAVTTNIGHCHAGDDPLQLTRLHANSGDDHRLLRAKLRGAYDWVRWPQNLAKRAKHLVRGRRPAPCSVSATP